MSLCRKTRPKRRVRLSKGVRLPCSAQFLCRATLPCGFAVSCWLCSSSGEAFGQNGPAKTENTPGQFFQIVEPITHETLARVRAATRQLVDRNAAAEQATRPILVFEFLPGDTAPGSSEFGACYDLASLISRDLAGRQADRRVHVRSRSRVMPSCRRWRAPRS